MARLIDADALPRHGRRGGLVHWKDIENAPTIDAEPVVRCKDCKWGVDYYHEGDCYCLHPKCGLTYFDGSWKFYCADGERREDEK